MRQKLLCCFVALFHSTYLFPSFTPHPLTPKAPAFFSTKITTHYYCGQDFNLFSDPNFDPYTLFQYIVDFGIEKNKEPIRGTNQTISLTAKARMKGLLGNIGSGLVPLQEVSPFQIWIRELFLMYTPTENENSFAQLGFFPFKVGGGFVLGNAYNISIPIAWQYIPEQINQYRPGFLIRISDKKKSVFADAYVGIIATQNNLATTTSTLKQTLINTALTTLDAAFIEYSAKNNVVASFQMNFGPFENHTFQLSPYIFFHKSKQDIEFTDDAMSTLYTPGFSGYYEKGSVRLNFECAKNCGQQQVFALDRNIILPNSNNIQLFYDPVPNAPLNNVTNADFISSPYAIPDDLAAHYGNGTNFLYPINPATFVFKNSYNRYRKSYYNTYEGFFAYADLLVTKKNLTWALGAAYMSGANDPNDSYETILITRLTPGVTYKDYNKPFKGFMGTNQFSEASNIYGLYFGAGDFRYTNLTFIGSTLGYSQEKEHNTVTARATVVSYFKPVPLLLNVTNAEGVNPFAPLPHYIGTEINWFGSYALGTHFTFTLQGGVMIPGKFYTRLQAQLTQLEQEAINATQMPSADTQITSTPLGINHCYFISGALTWFFDSVDIKKFFKHHS